jgi:hypothetical protein
VRPSLSWWPDPGRLIHGVSLAAHVLRRKARQTHGDIDRPSLGQVVRKLTTADRLLAEDKDLERENSTLNRLLADAS